MYPIQIALLSKPNFQLNFHCSECTREESPAKLLCNYARTHSWASSICDHLPFLCFLSLPAIKEKIRQQVTARNLSWCLCTRHQYKTNIKKKLVCLSQRCLSLSSNLVLLPQQGQGTGGTGQVGTVRAWGAAVPLGAQGKALEGLGRTWLPTSTHSCSIAPLSCPCAAQQIFLLTQTQQRFMAWLIHSWNSLWKYVFLLKKMSFRGLVKAYPNES